MRDSSGPGNLKAFRIAKCAASVSHALILADVVLAI
jgi:hypothetical protein